MDKEKKDITIKLAKTAGFCFGVKRAVNTVYEQIEKGDKLIYTYGPIIHNEEVVKDLEEKGVKVIESEDDIEKIEADATVVIRSHGTTEKICDLIKAKGANIVDATCPFVKKIHIYSNEKEIFTPLIDYFFENYGILLTLGDTIGSDTKEKGIFISLTEDQNKQETLIKAAEQAVQISPFLCKTPQYFERFYFDCNRSLERIIKKLGLIFDSESLIFLYSVWANEKNKKTFSEFTKKFDIKILKFVKND